MPDDGRIVAIAYAPEGRYGSWQSWVGTTGCWSIKSPRGFGGSKSLTVASLSGPWGSMATPSSDLTRGDAQQTRPGRRDRSCASASASHLDCRRRNHPTR